VAAILEEACHFGREDRAAHPLSDIVGSLRPALLTHEATGGKILFVSSPWVKSGLLWEMCEQHAANADITLVTQLPSRDLNPTLSEIEMGIQRRLQGESWFRREYLSEFVESGEPLIPAEAIDSAVVKGCLSFFPVPAPSVHVAGFDLSARGDD